MISSVYNLCIQYAGRILAESTGSTFNMLQSILPPGGALGASYCPNEFLLPRDTGFACGADAAAPGSSAAIGIDVFSAGCIPGSAASGGWSENDETNDGGGAADMRGDIGCWPDSESECLECFCGC